MIDAWFSDLAAAFNGEVWVWLVMGAGAFIAATSFAAAFNDRRRLAAARMAPARKQRTRRAGLVIEDDTPSGLLGAVLPSNREQRFAVAQALGRAGFRAPWATAAYYLIRVGLGLLLPLIFVCLVALAGVPGAPTWVVKGFSGWSATGIIQMTGVLVAIGFLAPARWLASRIAKRRRDIEDSFPNMLDLLQVGVEAGLGLDQALLRVAAEIQHAAPDLAEEILTALSEIQAGRDRDQAMLKMARRTGVAEMASFVNMLLQSQRFGSPMAEALQIYADEMRQIREMRAQEQANKLPVKMSAVMASLMLPGLIALILTPVVLRYMVQFG